MATARGYGEPDKDAPVSTRSPKSPDFEDSDEALDPSVLKVKADTAQVFQNFMYHRLTSQIEQEAEEGDLDIPDIPKRVLSELRSPRISVDIVPTNVRNGLNAGEVDQLGLKLAQLGDEIHKKYRSDFSSMVSSIFVGESSGLEFDTFTRIARRLFTGGVSLGRIIALLCFGYELALTILRRGWDGVKKFLKKICRFVVEFIVKENIAKWIADQGGWMKVVDVKEQSFDTWMRRVFLAGSLIIVCAGMIEWASKST